jgi:cytoskeleton protein RodZ
MASNVTFRLSSTPKLFFVREHAAVLQDRRSKLAETNTMMSSVRQDDSDAVTAARVGADLRNARERLGWSLPAIAAHLRIRLPFLEAIEDGRIRDLPGNAYAVGFVRTYANSLGLAPDEIARRFRAEAADINRKTELTFPAPVPERGVPAGAVVLLGAVLAIGAYVGGYRMSGDGRPAPDTVQPVPERLTPLAGTTGMPTQPAQPAPSASTTEPAPTPAAAPTSMPTAMPSLAQTNLAQAPGISPGSAAAAVPALPVPAANAPAMASAIAASPSSASALAAPAAPNPVVPVAADGGRIVLRATQDAWVQVRDRTGPVLLNRVLRVGETWPVPNKGSLLLTTGNAGGTELLVDGTATPSLGGDGAVRRDLPLDPDAIRDGKLALASPVAKPVVRQP